MRNLLESLKERRTKKLVRSFLRNRARISPVKARNVECSMIFSNDDVNSKPSEYLISASLTAIQEARRIDLSDISRRLKMDEPLLPDIWPGEHYKLLAGFTAALRPKLVVEIGTERGISALCMAKYLPENSKLLTFDTRHWRSYQDSCLKDGDFSDGRLVQYVDDLTNPTVTLKYKEELKEADLILIDVAKDGVMEQRFLDNFKLIPFIRKPLLIFDDIRFWNMLKIWRNISLPKLDLTSFGHWSGTGVCEFLSSCPGV